MSIPAVKTGAESLIHSGLSHVRASAQASLPAAQDSLALSTAQPSIRQKPWQKIKDVLLCIWEGFASIFKSRSSTSAASGVPAAVSRQYSPIENFLSLPAIAAAHDVSHPIQNEIRQEFHNLIKSELDKHGSLEPFASEWEATFREQHAQFLKLREQEDQWASVKEAFGPMFTGDSAGEIELHLRNAQLDFFNAQLTHNDRICGDADIKQAVTSLRERLFGSMQAQRQLIGVLGAHCNPKDESRLINPDELHTVFLKRSNHPTVIKTMNDYWSMARTALKQELDEPVDQLKTTLDELKKKSGTDTAPVDIKEQVAAKEQELAAATKGANEKLAAYEETYKNQVRNLLADYKTQAGSKLGEEGTTNQQIFQDLERDVRDNLSTGWDKAKYLAGNWGVGTVLQYGGAQYLGANKAAVAGPLAKYMLDTLSSGQAVREGLVGLGANAALGSGWGPFATMLLNPLLTGHEGVQGVDQTITKFLQNLWSSNKT